jgi:hypothetical protein
MITVINSIIVKAAGEEFQRFTPKAVREEELLAR